MGLEGQYENGVVRVAGDARQRFHDSRGYGYPLTGNEIALSPVEAAHLLFRGNLDCVWDDGTELDAQSFVAREPGTDFGVRFLVYADLRSRGFYLAPATTPWVETPPDGDFVVYARGTGPNDGTVAFPCRVLGERTDVPAETLEPGVLAVVDEESEITYFEIDRVEPRGSSSESLPSGLDATLLADRVVVWEPPAVLYERGFYGQPLEGRTAGGEHVTLQCSLLEAASLATQGVLSLDPQTVIDRGRSVEGERFDRRLFVYTTLRERGVVPKTGYKFGADFRTYADIESVDTLGHSELLVRVHPSSAVFEPRGLALDVRLAHGVRKTMVYATVDTTDESIEWWSIKRLTP